MKWTNALMAATFLFAAASAWACGDDPAAAGACPKDDVSTPDVDESECKAIADIDSGRLSVERKGCKNCHGDDMSGTTAALTGKDEYKTSVTGEAVELFPPNLTNDDATGVGTWSDDALALAIRTGVDTESQLLCPQMQHFVNMSDFEVYSVVMYLRSLPAVSKKIPRSVCPPTKTKEQQ